MGGKGGAPAKDLPLIVSQFYVHLYLKSGGWGGSPSPSPRGSEPLFEKSSFTCNGSQRANVRDTNDIDFQFDEQPYFLNLPAVYRWTKTGRRSTKFRWLYIIYYILYITVYKINWWTILWNLSNLHTFRPSFIHDFVFLTYHGSRYI